MESSTILLANYPKGSAFAQFVTEDNNRKMSAIFGYDVPYDPKDEQLKVADDLISSLFTYEKILIFANNITELINSIGYDDLIILLRLHLIQVIPDFNFNPAMILEGKTWKPDFMSYSFGNGPVMYNHRFGHLEFWLRRKGFSDLQVNTLIVLLEENAADFDDRSAMDTILSENTNDLRRLDFLTDKEFFRVNEGKLECNLTSELRLFHLNSLLCVASIFSVDGLKADGAINSLLLKKATPLMPISIPDGSKSLNSITLQKGFPNLGELYINKVIQMGDILTLRDSFNGKMFRYWANKDGYQEENMRQDVMNSLQGVLGSKAGNLIRMVAGSCVGILGFVPGAAASIFDSIIMDKLSKGWHPNLFLDNKLKALIDEKIAESKHKHDVEMAKERFKGVGRNDLCPCGSGIKFKKCHGKDLF